MEALFGLILLLIVGVVAWCVASEGAWGSVLTFLCVLLAGLLATNFFEPLADLIERKAGRFAAPYADVVAFVGLFALLTFLLRMATDALSPTDIELDARLFQPVRWLFAAATGYTTMAILLTALHTAPLPREFAGFRPEGNNLFEMCAPDRQWLGFVQHISEKVLRSGRVFDGPDFTRFTVDPPYLSDGVEQHVWPSFPIRYATRRQELASGSTKKVGAGSLPGGGSNAPASGSAPAF